MESDADPQQGGGGAAGIRIFLLRHGPVGADFWCRNLGGNPLHGPGTGGVPGPGVLTVDREAHVETV